MYSNSVEHYDTMDPTAVVVPYQFKPSHQYTSSPPPRTCWSSQLENGCEFPFLHHTHLKYRSYMHVNNCTIDDHDVVPFVHGCVTSHALSGTCDLNNDGRGGNGVDSGSHGANNTSSSNNHHQDTLKKSDLLDMLHHCDIRRDNVIHHDNQELLLNGYVYGVYNYETMQEHYPHQFKWTTPTIQDVKAYISQLSHSPTARRFLLTTSLIYMQSLLHQVASTVKICFRRYNQYTDFILTLTRQIEYIQANPTQAKRVTQWIYQSRGHSMDMVDDSTHIDLPLELRHLRRELALCTQQRREIIDQLVWARNFADVYCLIRKSYYVFRLLDDNCPTVYCKAFDALCQQIFLGVDGDTIDFERLTLLDMFGMLTISPRHKPSFDFCRHVVRIEGLQENFDLDVDLITELHQHIEHQYRLQLNIMGQQYNHQQQQQMLMKQPQHDGDQQHHPSHDVVEPFHLNHC